MGLTAQDYRALVRAAIGWVAVDVVGCPDSKALPVQQIQHATGHAMNVVAAGLSGRDDVGQGAPEVEEAPVLGSPDSVLTAVVVFDAEGVALALLALPAVALIGPPVRVISPGRALFRLPRVGAGGPLGHVSGQSSLS